MADWGQSTRQRKVSRQIQRDLSELFQRNASTFGVGRMVTVTAVRITPDLEMARVYLSVFPSSDAKTVLAQISAQAREIRYQLGQRVRHQLRVVPELHFAVDDSLDYIENIDRLLNGDE